MKSEASEALQVRTTSIRTGIHLVAASGELDRTSVDRLRRELDRLPTASDVVVDIDGLYLADSDSFALLVQVVGRQRRLGKELTVVCERQPTTRSVLRRAGLDVAEEHDKAIRYLMGVKLMKRLREHTG